jgi:hypothetical protein
MLNRVINGDDILVHAKPLAIKAHYTKWKALSQLERLTLTDFLESDEKVAANFLILLHAGSDDYAVIHHGAEHRKAFGQDLSVKSSRRRAAASARGAGRPMIRCANREFPVRTIYASEGTNTAAG